MELPPPGQDAPRLLPGGGDMRGERQENPDSAKAPPDKTPDDPQPPDLPVLELEPDRGAGQFIGGKPGKVWRSPLAERLEALASLLGGREPFTRGTRGRPAARQTADERDVWTEARSCARREAGPRHRPPGSYRPSGPACQAEAPPDPCQGISRAVAGSPCHGTTRQERETSPVVVVPERGLEPGWRDRARGRSLRADGG